MKTLIKRLLSWAVIVALLLLIPVWGNMYIDGWNWSPFDFVWAGVLLFSIGSLFEFVRAKSAGNRIYTVAGGLALATALVLIWINAAVGIIGNDDGSNLIYFVALLVGFIGAIYARLEPRGMAVAMFVLALAVALVPIIALFIGQHDFAPGMLQVFTLNTFFVVMFAGSGFLFRQAAHTKVTTI